MTLYEIYKFEKYTNLSSLISKIIMIFYLYLKHRDAILTVRFVMIMFGLYTIIYCILLFLFSLFYLLTKNK